MTTLSYPCDCGGWICPDCEPYGCSFTQGKEDLQGNIIHVQTDMRKLTQRGNKLKHTLDSWVEYKTLGVTHQGQIIDYLIDDDDEEYLVRHKDDELKWVAGVVLRPIELPPEPPEPPAAEFLAEG